MSRKRSVGGRASSQVSNAERYTASQASSLKRVVSWFLTTRGPNGLQKYHAVLSFSDAIRATLETDDTTPLIKSYMDMRNPGKKTRSEAQNNWLDDHCKLDPASFCTAEGSKMYDEFLSTLTKGTGKDGNRVVLGQEGQKAYTKAINKYFKNIGFTPDVDHRHRMKNLHKRAANKAALGGGGLGAADVNQIVQRAVSDAVKSALADYNAQLADMRAPTLQDIEALLERRDAENRQANQAQQQAQLWHWQQQQQAQNGGGGSGSASSGSSDSSVPPPSVLLLSPISEWKVFPEAGAPPRTVVVPPGHKLGNVTLAEALQWWEQGLPLDPDSVSGRAQSIRPFRYLRSEDWDDAKSRKQFTKWAKVMDRLAVLTRLTGQSNLSQISSVVEACVQHFRLEYVQRTATSGKEKSSDDATDATPKTRKGYRTNPFSNKMQTVYLYVSSATDEMMEGWYRSWANTNGGIDLDDVPQAKRARRQQKGAKATPNKTKVRTKAKVVATRVAKR